MIQIKDVQIDTERGMVSVNFPYASKHREKGFSFYIPAYLHNSFCLYCEQLSDEEPTARFMRNWSKTQGRRLQNMGYKKPTSFCRMIEEKLGLEEGSLTTHFGRQSGAVALADAGCSKIELKQAGRWDSDAVAEDYISHSHAAKTKRVGMLVNGAENLHQKKKKRRKKQKAAESTVSSKSRDEIAGLKDPPEVVNEMGRKKQQQQQ